MSLFNLVKKSQAAVKDQLEAAKKDPKTTSLSSLPHRSDVQKTSAHELEKKITNLINNLTVRVDVLEEDNEGRSKQATLANNIANQLKEMELKIAADGALIAPIGHTTAKLSEENRKFKEAVKKMQVDVVNSTNLLTALTKQNEDMTNKFENSGVILGEVEATLSSLHVEVSSR